MTDPTSLRRVHRLRARRVMIAPMLAATLGASEPAASQAAPVSLAEPRITVTAGGGNAMGWFGMQAERYLAHGRLSAFGGLGYTFKIDDYDPEGVTLAAGVRGYTAGLKHRGFAEASVCQVGTLSDPEHPRRFYGPCGQLGYQFASRGGFTALFSLGVGYALSAGRYRNRTLGLLGFGLGYTWRERELGGRGVGP
jgi:hypothetical protein